MVEEKKWAPAGNVVDKGKAPEINALQAEINALKLAIEKNNKCHNCGKEGHFIVDCKEPKRDNKSDNKGNTKGSKGRPETCRKGLVCHQAETQRDRSQPANRRQWQEDGPLLLPHLRPLVQARCARGLVEEPRNPSPLGRLPSQQRRYHQALPGQARGQPNCL
jgi:Zinc knuckle